MNNVLQSIIGQLVEVLTQAGGYDYRDKGILLAYDERWIQVQKPTGEMIFFPIANIRLLKPVSS